MMPSGSPLFSPTYGHTSAGRVGALLAAMCVAATGCDRRSATGTAGEAAAPAAIEQTATLGDPAHPDARVVIRADRAAMTVADRLTLDVTIDSAAQTKVDWVTPAPEPPNGRLGDFTVAAHSQRTIPGRPGITEHVFVLEPFLDGKKTIPPLAFRVSGGVGGATGGEVSTQPLTVEVSSLLPADEAEKAELAPVLPPLAAQLAPPPRDTRQLALIGAVAATALACLILIIASFARRRKAVDNPIAIARKSLAELRAGLESAAADPFGPAAARVAGAASELGTIIRMVLDRGLSIAAVGATASELAPRLAASNLPPTTREPIERVLRALEQEAFSPAQPRAAVLLEHVTVAEELVRTASSPQAAGGARA